MITILPFAMFALTIIALAISFLFLLALLLAVLEAAWEFAVTWWRVRRQARILWREIQAEHQAAGRHR